MLRSAFVFWVLCFCLGRERGFAGWLRRGWKGGGIHGWECRIGRGRGGGAGGTKSSPTLIRSLK